MPAVQSRGPELIVIQSVCVVATWVATGLRAYVKCALTRDHTIDDGVMYLSTMLYSAYAAAALIGIVQGGIGRHTSDLDSASIVIALQVWYTCEILFAFISAIIRTSICLFMLRVFKYGLPRAILRATTAVVWTSSTVYLLIIVFQCNPPRYYWAQFEGTSGSCRPASLVPNATIVHSVIAAVSDWVIGILPLQMLWKLQKPRAEKLPLIFFFGVGVVYVCSYVAFSDVALLSLVEPSIGIVAGCIATLRPLNCGWISKPKAHSRSSQGASRVPHGAIRIQREVLVSRSEPFPLSDLSQQQKSMQRSIMADGLSYP